MANNRKEKIGSVYYDKKDKKWKCTYYIFEQEIEKIEDIQKKEKILRLY